MVVYFILIKIKDKNRIANEEELAEGEHNANIDIDKNFLKIGLLVNKYQKLLVYLQKQLMQLI